MKNIEHFKVGNYYIFKSTPVRVTKYEEPIVTLLNLNNNKEVSLSWENIQYCSPLGFNNISDRLGYNTITMYKINNFNIIEYNSKIRYHDIFYIKENQTYYFLLKTEVDYFKATLGEIKIENLTKLNFISFKRIEELIDHLYLNNYIVDFDKFIQSIFSKEN